MQDLNARLKRVIGQLGGIMRMMDEGRDCEKIIVQFQAAKAALDSAFAEALNRNLENCLKCGDPEKMKRIIKLLAKS